MLVRTSNEPMYYCQVWLSRAVAFSSGEENNKLKEENCYIHDISHSKSAVLPTTDTEERQNT